MNAALLVASSQLLLDQINAELDKQLGTLPRADIVRASLSEQSVSVVCDNRELIVAIVDTFAPEHLHLDVSYHLVHVLQEVPLEREELV